MVLMPDIILLSVVENLLKVVRDDFAAQTDEKNTILYKLLTGKTLERYDMFTQAKKVILAKEDDPRFLRTNLFFNLERAAIPTIHIMMQGEQYGQNAVSIDEGGEQPDFNTTTLEHQDKFIRRYNASYSFVVTSDNTNETLLVYHLLRSLLVSAINHLELSGLQTIKFTGTDISLDPSLVPKHIFTRGIGMTFTYETQSLRLDKLKYATSITSTGIISSSATSWEFGNAIHFDGVNDFIVVQDDALLRGMSQLSIEFWVKPEQFGNDIVLINKLIGGSADGAYDVELDPTGKLRVFLGTTSGFSGVGYSSPNILNLNKYTYVGVTYDGTLLKIYENAVQVLSATPVGSGSPLKSNTDKLFIGAGDAAAFLPFKGTLDEMRIYRRAMTTTEFQSNYNQGLGAFPTNVDQLVGWWRFNESSGTIANEEKNNLDGTLTNMPGDATNWVTH